MHVAACHGGLSTEMSPKYLLAEEDQQPAGDLDVKLSMWLASNGRHRRVNRRSPLLLNSRLEHRQLDGASVSRLLGEAELKHRLVVCASSRNISLSVREITQTGGTQSQALGAFTITALLLLDVHFSRWFWCFKATCPETSLGNACLNLFTR